MAVSICIGCGCTDDCACFGGCSWLVREGRVGVCSSCTHALPAWNGKLARLAGWAVDGLPGKFLKIRLNGKDLAEYAPGRGQPPGTYFVENLDAGTVILVDEQGMPNASEGGSLQIQGDYDAVARAKEAHARRYGLPSVPSADQRRGKALKTQRGRARAKVASKTRQAARRRS